jgi:SAM-dependent methyltransferase
MSLFYRFAYWIGLKPWEDLASLPIREQIRALLDREDAERAPSQRTALDLGCGTGIWAAELAARGWRVTGVDLVPRALEAARRRARERGVECRFVHGDLTALRAAGVGDGFHFILDLGAIHGLTNAQRASSGQEVRAVAAPGATMVILAWAPANRGPLPRGMGRDDLAAVFTGWTIVDDQAAETTGAPAFIRKARPRFYCLRRDAT